MLSSDTKHFVEGESNYKDQAVDNKPFMSSNYIDQAILFYEDHHIHV